MSSRAVPSSSDVAMMAMISPPLISKEMSFRSRCCFEPKQDEERGQMPTPPTYTHKKYQQAVVMYAVVAMATVVMCTVAAITCVDVAMTTVVMYSLTVV
jgi:hypothetical protein